MLLQLHWLVVSVWIVQAAADKAAFRRLEKSAFHALQQQSSESGEAEALDEVVC